MSDFNVGDKVEVLNEGLAMLRNLCPTLPPNHHRVVSEIWDDGELLILFDDTQSAAPYPVNQVRKRACSTCGQSEGYQVLMGMQCPECKRAL